MTDGHAESATDANVTPRQFGRSAARCAFWIVAAVWLAALGVRLTVRDTVPVLALAYYVFPASVLGFVALVLAVQSWATGWKRWGACWLALSLACGVWCVRTSYFHAVRDAGVDSHRILLWNVHRGSLGSSPIVDEIRRIDADLVALVEATSDELQSDRFWRRNLPDYQAATLEGGIVVLSKVPLTHKGAGLLRNQAGRSGGRYRAVEVELAGTSVTVIVADIRSNPLMRRDGPLRALGTVVNEFSNGPLLVVGDFNTPSDSAHFDDLRATLTHAFETAGTGYAATWPVPLPALAIDQIWGNRRIRFDRCRHGWSWRSDHRPVIAEFGVEQ